MWRFVPCPTGVKSNLKSPVCTIFPCGVLTITPKESGIECVVLWNDTFKYLNSKIVSSSITFNSALANKLCSSNFDLINPIARGPP